MAYAHDLQVEQQTITAEFEHASMNVEHVLVRFEPISLDEMERVALLNRTDTKYVMRASQLCHALQQITQHYRVLEIDRVRLNLYQTLYFDTPNFALYRQHHNGLRSRYKVRMREYVNSDLAFVEVKRKTNRNRTIKSRLQAPQASPRALRQVDDFVDKHTPFDPDVLEPKLWNQFLRMTLVSKHRVERLTLDLNLEFGWENAYTALPGIAIAEVKQDRVSQRSDFTQQMRLLGIRPTRFSKYCAGVYMLYDDVKINNFKTRIRLVDKLMQEEMGDECVS